MANSGSKLLEWPGNERAGGVCVAVEDGTGEIAELGPVLFVPIWVVLHPCLSFPRDEKAVDGAWTLECKAMAGCAARRGSLCSTAMVTEE
ncbi:hypothetical protein E4U54_008155 [Claviceps lovelessii]|nr:hypothetical protein E4U54_008155 [Claviceps lovelessii]